MNFQPKFNPRSNLKVVTKPDTHNVFDFLFCKPMLTVSELLLILTKPRYKTKLVSSWIMLDITNLILNLKIQQSN